MYTFVHWTCGCAVGFPAIHPDSLLVRVSDAPRPGVTVDLCASLNPLEVGEAGDAVEGAPVEQELGEASFTVGYTAF